MNDEEWVDRNDIIKAKRRQLEGTGERVSILDKPEIGLWSSSLSLQGNH
jgi:hypothetical protein